MDTDNHSVKRISGYPRPVLLRASKQLRQVRLQAKTPRIFPVSTVISLLESQEVVMHVRKVIKHIAETHILGVFAQLELVCFAILFLFSLPHGVSRITPLSSAKWEADTLPGSPPVTGKGVVTLRMSANVIHILNHNLLRMSSVFFKRCSLTHEVGLSSHYLKVRVSSPYFR